MLTYIPYRTVKCSHTYHTGHSNAGIVTIQDSIMLTYHLLQDSVVLTGGGRTVVRPVSRRTSQHCLPQGRKTSQLQLGAGLEEAAGIIGGELYNCRR